MKTLKFLVPLWAFAFLIVACSEAPEGESAEVSEANEEKESVGEVWSISEGTVNWVGSAPGKQHNGIVEIVDGGITVNNGTISGGDFAIDMNTIVVQDLAEDEGKAKLEGHLRSGDFFQIENHPYVKFSVTNVELIDDREDANYLITGNLTIKEITKGISFPAMINVTDGEVNAKSSKFTIDRTEWDIKYNSGIIGTAQDKLINDKVALQIDLTANKPVM